MIQRLSDMNLPRFPLLSDQELMELLHKAQNGDIDARERLVNCNLKLIFNMIQRFSHRGYDLEDLFQIGTIGLIKAIDKFDFSYGVKFSTYAVPMIIGEIRRFLRDDHPIKVPRSYKELVYKINRSREKLSSELNREPTLNEIAEDIGTPSEDIILAIEAVQSPSSIHDTLYQDDSDPIYVIDQLPQEKDADPGWFEKIALQEVLDKLPGREKEVLYQRFFEDRTQNEIAKVMNLSQVQISRIERAALLHLKQILNDSPYE
ncbi:MULTISPECIES: RNA polymerase sporulation sigma factor SigF [Dehalobacter]|uniref:RNA polymerase sigma factor n=2 Tax=Dehalobacter restrictus TaxID=55583 RepID=A0A857DGH7_9FIRM|nr:MULTISPECIES: RNA polymerase sporulation sigma factor SigF [Dehalobacter]AHF09827.1 RNA polymerase sigma70 [Dehalobacter restrictus DSM 9455]MCG1026113.1 RNA polymerase sporulation sigma factor SigF [Dehalobacter sp.]MDJ0305042.1 RNA polymerase sporulation sigma factor SigF [Dehalobacter sp.]OCZ53449.1 RNA polymerase sigma-F factor [Dehalobacter sp. TeCB1]QHA00410.1 RNA polymerase sporulation sigma factor SigF [Dehalobacter restrictus]